MNNSPSSAQSEREAFEALMRSRGEDYLYRRDVPGCEKFGEYCRQNVQDQWEVWQARAGAGAQAKPEKRAPVQGYTPGIPWSLHLEAYDVYCKRWTPQPAMIDLEGRNCRGGFSTGELDSFIPGWRDRVSEIAQLKARIAELEAAASAQATPDCHVCGFDCAGANPPVMNCPPSPDAREAGGGVTLSADRIEQIMSLVEQHGDYRWAHCIGGRGYDAKKAVETRDRICAILREAGSGG